MKILILNWRSIKDPLAGGAELATLEYSKRWVKKHNAEVTWMCAPYKIGLKKEKINGIKFHYVGYPLERDKTLKMVFLFPFFYILVYLEYLKSYKNKIDLIIDQSHGIPFLTPLYSKEKIILYIHEYADKIWDKMFNFPINIIGKILESNFLKFYKKVITITGSIGTKNDLIDNLAFNKDNIHIVNYSINLKVLEKPTTKYNNFTILYLNRVVKMKRPEIAINVFSKIKKIIPNSVLILAGRYDSNYKKELEKLVTKLNLEDVIFKGFIDEEEKINLLQKSHVLINTSMKEGWGLVNIEANSQGTPVVAFNVEGCKESVKTGVSGYLAEDEEEMVSQILEIRTKNLEQSSIDYSKQFNYDDKAEDFWKVLNEK